MINENSVDRKANIVRKTTETDITLALNIDGKGAYNINSGVPFLDHMLEQFTKHSRFDLILLAKGDTEVDLHHLVEDTGIAVGTALREASADKRGIRRFGSSSVPMDEALCNVSCDFSGRSFFVFNFKNKDMTKNPVREPLIFSQNLESDALREIFVDTFFNVYSNIFFEALCKNALITLHINVPYGYNAHHIVESVFKSVGRAISDALKPTGANDLPSTKGTL